MVKFICLFFPALMCIGLYEALSKKDLNHKCWAYMYSLDVVLINGIVFAIKQYLLKTATLPLIDTSGDMLPSVAFNYLLMSVISAVGIAVAQVFLSKHAKVAIEENPNEH